MSPGSKTAAVRSWPMLLVAVLLALTGCGGGSSGSRTPAATAATTSSFRSVLPTPPPGMATVPLASLPAEARDLVDALDHGGTFKYRQDGTTFGNREGRLPAKPRGYYREYTVTTPGLVDRGPRRIIAGRDGELYYTSDHYRTFQWIVREGSP